MSIRAHRSAVGVRTSLKYIQTRKLKLISDFVWSTNQFVNIFVYLNSGADCAICAFFRATL